MSNIYSETGKCERIYRCNMKYQQKVYESHLHSNHVGNLRVCGPDKLRTAENTVLDADQSAGRGVIIIYLRQQSKLSPSQTIKNSAGRSIVRVFLQLLKKEGI